MHKHHPDMEGLAAGNETKQMAYSNIAKLNKIKKWLNQSPNNL
jgi:hypothetical protein